ncbi:fimbrial protein [Enterobacter sp. KBR-315C3_2022]|uniref:fimbrial protein n=1 Tax=Enterobacter sp. KBR-315C3_2022 TaxID=3242494 RepID=UPI0035295DC9
MNKLSFTSIALLSVLSTAPAFASSDNTISFQGEVTDQTCSLTVNGNETAPIILLPTVAATSLAASGDVAGATTFDMGVTGCTSATSSTTISTVFVGNLVDTTNEGTLGNSGTAKNVNIQILDSSDTAIDLSSTYTASGDLTLATGDTAATSTYTAQYYATGAATAGTVAASLQYAISYQ